MTESESTAGSSPLYPLLNEINKAATSGLPFIAIAMAVALPDICVSLASPDGRTNPSRYKEWCNKNLPKEQFSFVTSDDLYSMRCGVLHNGRFGDLKHNVARVLFIPPETRSMVDCRADDAYLYGVVDFCRNITSAVYRWFEANRSDPVVQGNLPRLMQYRPDGVSPYIRGITVLG